MAIVKFGAMVVGIRGLVEGMIFSANKSGPYVTGWHRSANPRTQFQTSQRAALARIPVLWRALTFGEQLAWNVFAGLPAQDRTNSLGEIFSASGFNWFSIVNIRLINMGRATRVAVPTQSRPSAPTILTMQLPFTAERGAWLTYASGAFAPDFDQVIEIAIHPSTGLNVAPKRFKLLLLDQDPSDTDAGFIVPYVNRINIASSSYRGYAQMYRQTTDGLRSAPASLTFDFGDTPSFSPAADDYDGVTNFGLRGANLTGVANSTTALFSFWFRIDGGDGTVRIIASNTASRYNVRLDGTNHLDIALFTSAGAVVARLTTTETFLAGPDWHHAACAVDTNASLHILFVDNALAPLTVDTFFATRIIDWSQADHSFGSDTGSANLWDGCLSQFYMNITSTIDIAVNNNLRAFINLSDTPEFLGALGTFPTKDAPILFFPSGDPSANSGTGGNYVNNAALVACGTTP